MDVLLTQLPELVVHIVECLDEEPARDFGLTCRDADAIVNYVFKTKCLKLSTEYRGWEGMDLGDPSQRWGKLMHETLQIRKMLLIAWSFHTYTKDDGEKVFDHSRNKCHGNRIRTAITEGQFGKALHLAPSPNNPNVQGAQVLAMLNALPNAPIKQFTLSLWLQVSPNDTSPILSLLFAQKFTQSQQYAHQSLTFILLNINSKGNLFFGRLGVESQYSLQPQKWYHVVMTSDSHTIKLYLHDKENGEEYMEILQAPQKHPLQFEKLVVVLGNGKKGDFIVEEMCMVGSVLDKSAFWWLKNGLPFV